MKHLLYIFALLFSVSFFGQIKSNESAFRFENKYVGVSKGGNISVVRPTPIDTSPTETELYTIANALSRTNEADATTGLLLEGVTLASIESSPSPEDGTSLIEITSTDQDSDRFEIDLNLTNGVEYVIKYYAWEASGGNGRSTAWVGFSNFTAVSWTETPTEYTHTLTTSSATQKLRFYNFATAKAFVDGLSIKQSNPTDPGGGTVPHIVLETKKAFPGAFGPAENATGGEGGIWMTVDNLNDTGAGSFRAAWTATVPRNVIVRVEGHAIKQTGIGPTSPNNGNVTFYGQFAPGNGLTVTGIYDTTPDLNLSDYTGRTSMSNTGNIILQHLTFQAKDVDCIPNEGCKNALDFFEIAEGTSINLKNLSLRYGSDETILLTSRFSNINTTVSYCIFGEARPEHNTGSIIGDQGSGQSPAGNHVMDRNWWQDISHRTPNVSGTSAFVRVMSNIISNNEARLMRTDGPVSIDFVENVVKQGNHAWSSTTAVNKMSGPNEGNFKTYTRDNWVSTWDESPNGLQTNLWVNFEAGEGAKNAPILSSHYSATPLTNFSFPDDGQWQWEEVEQKLAAGVGHNRGINADGSPGFFRDDIDTDYINRTVTGTTRSTYRDPSTWNHSSITGEPMYSDDDQDFMPDWFELQGFDQPGAGETALNFESATDRDQKIADWDFGDYTVDNREYVAGVPTGELLYTNFQICAAYYGGNFEQMIDGTNDLNITE